MTPELEDEADSLLASGGSLAKMLNGYGMTEVCGTVSTFQNHIFKKASVGISHSKNLISAFKINSANELKYGEVGEIYMSER